MQYNYGIIYFIRGVCAFGGTPLNIPATVIFAWVSRYETGWGSAAAMSSSSLTRSAVPHSGSKLPLIVEEGADQQLNSNSSGETRKSCWKKSNTCEICFLAAVILLVAAMFSLPIVFFYVKVHQLVLPRQCLAL